MATKGHMLYNKTRVATSAGVKTGAGKIWAILLFGGSANSSLLIYDNTSATGTDILAINTLAASTSGVTLVDLGGLDFTTGLYASIAGTGAVAYIWWG